MKKQKPELYSETARGRILRVSVEIFAEMGFGGTTFAEVARRSKMSKPNVAYHFATPTELLLEVMKLWAQTGQQVTSEVLLESLGLAPEDLVGKMAEAIFIWAERFPEFSSLTPVLIQAASMDHSIAALQRQIMSAGLNRILSLLEQIPGLKVRTARERLQLAETIHCLMMGSYMYALAQNRELSETKKQTVRMISGLLESGSNKQKNKRSAGM